MLHALLFSLIPVAAALIAGLVAVTRQPGERTTSAVQHFAAGVVFAAAAIELLPKVLERSPWVAIGGFAAGIAVMFGMRALTDRFEAQPTGDTARTPLPLGFIGATAIDFAIDGVILGAGFATNGTTGVLLTLALTVEYLFVGLSLSAALGPDTTRRLTIGAPVALSFLTVAGTALGVWLLAGASPTTLAAVLAFGAVAFMYHRGTPRQGPRTRRDGPRIRHLLHRLPAVHGPHPDPRLNRVGGQTWNSWTRERSWTARRASSVAALWVSPAPLEVRDAPSSTSSRTAVMPSVVATASVTLAAIRVVAAL